jgi:phosphoribosyl 1,2-cyclic phosphodiesterase
LDVYASQGTIDALGLANDRRTHIIKAGFLTKEIDKNCWNIFPFSLNHNTDEPLGFVIQADGEFLFFAPDTAYITQQFSLPFSIIALECSYDKLILEKRVALGDINESLAKRLLTSHQEKQVAMDYIEKYCELSKCREIQLLHMSSDNIDREQTRQEFEDRFFIKTIICNRKG